MIKKIGAIVERVREIPNTLMQFNKYMSKNYRALAKEASDFERITANHPDEKLAGLGKAFEQMLAHPLARKFRRNRISLYLQKSEKVQMPEIISAAGQLTTSPGALGIKAIIVPETLVNLLSLEELKASLGHEIGHHLRLDCHPRRGVFAIPQFRITQDSEQLADQIGVILSENPEAAKTMLEKIASYQREGVERLKNAAFSKIPDSRAGNIAKKLINKVTHYTNDTTSRAYPSLNQRKKAIGEMAERMATPEGRSFIEREVERKLEEQHRKLFPHLYQRDIGNTR